MILTAPQSQTVGLGVASVLVLGLGVIDDKIDLKWYFRIAGQALAALLMIEVGGVRIENLGPIFSAAPVSLGVMSVPLIIAATVGVINAVNMADGVDGLAGCVSFLALSMLAAAATYSGNGFLAMGLFVMMGAVAGFLVFNVRVPWRPRARVFLGNAGAEFLGLVIAWGSFRLTQNTSHPVNVVLAPFLLALPVIDCLVLMVRRLAARQSPFRADRNHMHHLLLDAGYSTSQVVLVMCGVSIVFGATAAIALRAHLPHTLFAAVFLLLTLAYYLLTRSRDRAVTLLAQLNPFRNISWN